MLMLAKRSCWPDRSAAGGWPESGAAGGWGGACLLSGWGGAGLPKRNGADLAGGWGGAGLPTPKVTAAHLLRFLPPPQAVAVAACSIAELNAMKAIASFFTDMRSRLSATSMPRDSLLGQQLRISLSILPAVATAAARILALVPRSKTNGLLKLEDTPIEIYNLPRVGPRFALDCRSRLSKPAADGRT